MKLTDFYVRLLHMCVLRKKNEHFVMPEIVNLILNAQPTKSDHTLRLYLKQSFVFLWGWGWNELGNQESI